MLMCGTLWSSESAGRECSLMTEKISDDTTFVLPYIVQEESLFVSPENSGNLKILYTKTSPCFLRHQSLRGDRTWSVFPPMQTQDLEHDIWAQRISVVVIFIQIFLPLLKLFAHFILSSFILLHILHLLNAIQMLGLQRHDLQ